MQLEIQIYKYLFDILQAAEKIQSFVKDLDESDYYLSDLVQSAVERQFEIIGEAANKLLKIAPEYGQNIPELKSTVAFRNVLIHGYASVDPKLVWGVISRNLDGLIDNVRHALPRDS